MCRTIRLMERSVHTGTLCIFSLSLYHNDLLLCWRLHAKYLIEITAFDYLAVNSGSLFISSLLCHQQNILFCSLLYHLQ